MAPPTYFGVCSVLQDKFQQCRQEQDDGPEQGQASPGQSAVSVVVPCAKQFSLASLTGRALTGDPGKQAGNQARPSAASSTVQKAELSWLQSREVPSFRIKAARSAPVLLEQQQASSPQASSLQADVPALPLPCGSVTAAPAGSSTSGLSGSPLASSTSSQQGAARLWAAAASAAAKTATSHSSVSFTAAASQPEMPTPGTYMDRGGDPPAEIEHACPATRLQPCCKGGLLRAGRQLVVLDTVSHACKPTCMVLPAWPLQPRQSHQHRLSGPSHSVNQPACMRAESLLRPRATSKSPAAPSAPAQPVPQPFGHAPDSFAGPVPALESRLDLSAEPPTLPEQQGAVAAAAQAAAADTALAAAQVPAPPPAEAAGPAEVAEGLLPGLSHDQGKPQDSAARADSAAEASSAVAADSAGAADAATGRFLAGLGAVLEESLQELSQLVSEGADAWEAASPAEEAQVFASAASSTFGTPRAPPSHASHVHVFAALG